MHKLRTLGNNNNNNNTISKSPSLQQQGIPPSLQPSAVKLLVTIPTVETFFQNEKSFSVYCVRISHHAPLDIPHTTISTNEIVSWKVFHDYGHFFNLHEELKKKYPKEIIDQIAPFPVEKTQFRQIVQNLSFQRLGMTDKDRIKAELKDYLQSVVDHSVLRADEQVKTCLFLRESNFLSRFQTLGRIKDKAKVKMFDPFISEQNIVVSPAPAPLSQPPPATVQNIVRRLNKAQSSIDVRARHVIGNQRGAEQAKEFHAMPPPPGDSATDAQIETYLLNNVRHPSQLRPFLMHYDNEYSNNNNNNNVNIKPGQPVLKRAQVASSVLPAVRLIAQDASKHEGKKPVGGGPKAKQSNNNNNNTQASSPFQRKNSDGLPEAIYKSIDYLLRSGLDVEGVFDAPCENSPKVQTYMRSFHEGLGQYVVFGHASEAAGCLLAHLATVPEPLLSYELHLCFLAINEELLDEEEKISRCRNLLNTLPSAALALIKYVIDFCAILVERCAERTRGLERIGNIMAPILLQRDHDDAEFPAAKNITKLLVKHHWKVFRKSGPVPVPAV